MDDRHKRATLYLEKAQEAYRLAGEATSAEAHDACLALGAHWKVLARFQLSAPLGELADAAEAVSEGHETDAAEEVKSRDSGPGASPGTLPCLPQDRH